MAAADHGSFRRAADALMVRQSTLSRCIRQLEESIGIVVFERSSGGVRATPAGRNFLHAARSILEQMDALAAIAHSAGRGEAGRLTVGFYTSLSAGNLRATLLDYARRFPQIEVDMMESSRTRLVTALRNGAVDIAIVTGETSLPESKAMPLWSERIIVALPDGHRLAASETIAWTDLKGETLLLNRARSRRRVSRPCRREARLAGGPAKDLASRCEPREPQESRRRRLRHQPDDRGLRRRELARLDLSGRARRRRAVQDRLFGSLARGQRQSRVGELSEAPGRALSSCPSMAFDARDAPLQTRGPSP